MTACFSQKQTKETKIGPVRASSSFVAFCSTSLERVLSAKRSHPSADTSPLEREMDERVHRLYALAPDEIKLVEGSGKK